MQITFNSSINQILPPQPNPLNTYLYSYHYLTQISEKSRNRTHYIPGAEDPVEVVELDIPGCDRAVLVLGNPTKDALFAESVAAGVGVGLV